MPAPPRLPHIFGFPWEENDTPPAAQASDATAAQQSTGQKAGCEVADETITAYGHLLGLSEGWGGFGVLQLSQQRLRKAAATVRTLGADALASDLLEIATEMESVATSEQAALLVQRFKPSVRQAWELGKHCTNVQKAMQAMSLLRKGALRLG